MIKSFKHKGLERFYLTGNKSGIQPAHAKKLQQQLFVLATAKKPEDADMPGWALHQLKGDRKEVWSITVNGNWRLTFKFIGQNVELLDYEDYH